MTRPVRRCIAGLAVAGITGAAACFSDSGTTSGPPTGGTCVVPASAAGATVVFVRNFAFSPAQVTVKAGGRVAWVNCETNGESHTSTSDGAGWDSPLLPPGGAFERAFPAVGAFSYHCEPHPFMTGRVTVE